MSKLDGSTTDVIMLSRLGRTPSDQAAWEAFVERYGPKIHAWCRAWRLQEADAQDVTQAVLAKLVVQLRRFAYDPSQSFRGWLRTMVKHVCADCLADRRRSLGATTQTPGDELDPIRTVAARDDLGRRLEVEFDLELLEEAERRVRRRVAPHTWEAYRLTALDGLSGAEAAARLGMKVAAVFISRSHVTKQLQREVKALEDPLAAARPL
jgi:RNA polymerase sigma factor (sigma-70 family)